ncbi:MAG: ParB/RepB/Spo0J family partition protein [Acidimicrobiales bacterium]
MRRGGLGKGLGALIPTEGVADREAVFRSVPISCIRPNPYQPRSNLDEETLAGLAASISTLGVLQPVLVRPVGDDQFELIAGERRWRAARRAGLQLIPALVQVADDVSTLEQALVENLHREDLSGLEEAAAYQQLIEDFGVTHEELARRVGKSRTTVTNTLRLLQLPPLVQRLIAERSLSPGHARALLGTPDRAFQESLARRAVTENLSVRAVEDAVRMRNEGPIASPGRRARPRSGQVRPAPVLELEELLAARLDTRVKVELGLGKGRVVIDFATVEDLERIYRAMVDGPPEAGLERAAPKEDSSAAT